MKEIWNNIAGYEGYYQVSNLGRVKSVGRTINRNQKGNLTIKEKIISSHILKNGYEKVDLYKNGKRKCEYVHRLVAESFIPNPNGKIDVNHINGNKTDNSVCNLEWTTRSENMKHAFNIGLCKITELQRKTSKNNGMKGIKAAIQRRKKKISQYDTDGNYIRTWNSITSAEKELGINLKHMSRHLSGKQKTLCGYIWKCDE